MPDQKAENLLNLSWDATEAEREKSLNLNIGYNTEERTWDVIVKYNGEVTLLEDQATRVVPLFNRYAIVTAPQERLEQILNEPQI